MYLIRSRETIKQQNETSGDHIARRGKRLDKSPNAKSEKWKAGVYWSQITYSTELALKTMDALSFWLPTASITPTNICCHGRRAVLFALQCRAAGTRKKETEVALAEG